MMSEYRFRGQRPKIGIRPTIDGRLCGVRESLEDQTMNMAKSVKELYESTLRHPDGARVECVIAESCIGGVAEAADCRAFFEKEGIGVSLTVTPCWCYGSETMDMDPFTSKAVWGFNGTERPGAVYLAAVLAGHNQKGLPAFGIYGKDVQNQDDFSIPEDVRDKLLSYAKGGLAVAWMKNKSYLSIGSVSMGIAGSIVDERFFQDYLGMRNEYIDMSEIKRRIDEHIYDEAEFQKALTWTMENCKEGKDWNPESQTRTVNQKQDDWRTVVKMTLIIRDLMIGNTILKKDGLSEEALGHNALISGFQGQRHWTDHFPNGDFAEAILNSSFDWNGIREAFLVATENDALNGVAMAMGHLLTGTAQVFADVRTYWSPNAIEKTTGWKPDGLAVNGFIHLINSGSASLDGTGEQKDTQGKPVMKPFWEIDTEEVGSCLKKTAWSAAITEYFRGGGFSSNYKTKGNMPITLSRINIIKGLGPVLQLAEGSSVALPENVHKKLDERTSPSWPTTWFVPRLSKHNAFKDVYTVMANWGANHGAFSYGYIGADLITLASMLRIPVCMHNIDQKAIFRPSAWSAFGMDSEGSDYRACSTYGPLYG